MKPNRIFAAFLILLIGFSCSQPVGNSLLTSASSILDGDTTDDSETEEGQIEISADNTEVSVSVDDADRVEITGKCIDLGRRKNRILVEVFAGEDETVTPYISNAINDFCQTDAAGLDPTSGEKCFWVTKGVGIVEPNPVNRSFPQCHDGVFGFSVKLGKILLNAGNPNFKYTVRFKLRTLDGILADTAWSHVSVTRNLNTPSIDKITANSQQYRCLVETSPARFNQDVKYRLFRSVSAVSSSGDLGNLYTGLDTSSVTPNLSVFSWEDVENTIVAGATYTYTMESSHEKTYVITNPYTVFPTQTSNSLTCEIAAPQIYMSVTPLGAPTPTCYFAPSGFRVNPGYGVGTVQYQWRYDTAPGWTGVNSDNDLGGGAAPGCGNSPNCTSSGAGVVSGIQYYYAVREIYTGAPFNIKGKWSNEVACTPP